MGLLEYMKEYVSHNRDQFQSYESVYDFFEILATENYAEMCEEALNYEKTLESEDEIEEIRVSDFVLSLEKHKKVDIAHAGNKQIESRVDAKKLAKAELKIKQKMQKRNKTDYFRPNDDQLREILDARGKMGDLLLSNFDISYSGLKILSDANLTLVYGRRYGLVGRNGIGKSTLLRALYSRQIEGMDRYKHVSFGHLEQELENNDWTCLEMVLKADLLREFLLREEERLKDDAHELRQVHEKLEWIMSSTAEQRASSILSGLGFSKIMQQQKTSDFSGGWRMRIALARALFTKPDVLLLDEPTNHLDIPAVVWLSDYLEQWKSTLIVVSHDREFLNCVATDILHMQNQKLNNYKGNFQMFEQTKDERQKQAIREYEAQKLYRQHLQDFIDRWRYNAKRAPQAQSKIKILEKLPDLEVVTEELNVKFKFPNPEKTTQIIQMNNVNFSYSKQILKNVSFSVNHGDKIAIVGPNGAGKSTILKLVMGELDPEGFVFRSQKAKFAYFSQHHVDKLCYDLNPVSFICSQVQITEEECRRHLGCFGISGRVGLQQLSTLSGGQKSRVVFACLAAMNPSVLLLDEPTNHLDYMSVDSLADGLKDYEGACLIVSHDLKFINHVCTQIYVCQDQQLIKFNGDIYDYKKSLK